MRKGRWDDIMREAIYKYEADRELLRRKYYVNSRFSFRWPSTDI
jgi:hypothetical protein